VSSAENLETCYKIGSSEAIKNSKDFEEFPALLLTIETNFTHKMLKEISRVSGY